MLTIFTLTFITVFTSLMVLLSIATMISYGPTEANTLLLCAGLTVAYQLFTKVLG